MNQRWNIDRRTFLRGTAGALLPLPFLNLMEGKTQPLAKGLANASSTESPPLRFVTLFKPNGVHPPSWNINGGTEFDFRTSPLMAPFAKHKDDLLILDNMGDFGFSSHANSTRRFLSGHHQNKDSASVDQVIADRIGGDTAHRSLELTTEGLFTGQIGCSYISYDKDGGAIPRESDPQLIFDRLFRNPLSDTSQRQSMSNLLDRVNDDAKALSRKAGYQDKQTLDQYLTAVRETERRLETLEKNSSAPRIDFSTLERPPLASNLNEQVDSMIDLIALALWTDSTRCITYMLGNSNSRMVFDFLGVNEQHHYLSHFFRNFSRSNLDNLLKISLWHMEKFDSLLTKLKSYQESDGTSLLDNSVVLFGSGMGHSDNHTAQRIPIVLAGNGQGRLKTGRYLRYSENREVSSLHLSLLKTFDVEADSYSASDAPLPGLDGSYFPEFRERPFESWATRKAGSITAQGRLRMSDNLDEAKVFYIDIAGQESVRIEVVFRDFHDFNLPYHVGTPITLTGNGSSNGSQLLITKVTELKSLFGNSKPGTQNG
ncbi:MAG: DUF1552 domain-containing protein [Opitutales bacterium]|jgi:hypothetical protein|nr:DUF1552 domain-containing protein [Opitutales bacterium]MBT5167007.1 DUF1552 domain-containing protein [Opitutales bacterium]MBT5815987.1 DUF1552 domain-containing protein [Opitutales bacterium]MBT6379445.1 DUF1552 domain-containing protein [Opitutales bacterium]MBT7865460.1 DUF1552 domain-containing protein [Opitutales bacterium]